MINTAVIAELSTQKRESGSTLLEDRKIPRMRHGSKTEE